jgi:prolyl-tRNA editing enzyme YbaK/EbsC (Cys-tRNA(Pro) deacylase)
LHTAYTRMHPNAMPTPNPEPKSAVTRVMAALGAHGLDHLPVREFTERTATAADAAAAIGTSVACIVKSLVFMAADQPILVLASGPNRVDVDKVGRLVGESIVRANANQVRQATGFAIGGVPPVGHPHALATYVDRDLLQHEEVWAAAGTPNTVFAIKPDDLVRITDGLVEDVSEAPSPAS